MRATVSYPVGTGRSVNHRYPEPIRWPSKVGKDQKLPSRDTVYWEIGTLALVEVGKAEQRLK